MAQLKMYRITGTPLEEQELPEGFSITNYKSPKDRAAWLECCRQGLLTDEAGEEEFISRISGMKDIKLRKDLLFLDYLGEHIGTVTAYVEKKSGMGYVHMVGIRPDFRGRGLGRYLNAAAIKKLEADGVKISTLTTDEWRKSAVKSYLSAGFLPVEYAEGMEERWQAVINEYGIEKVDMLYEDGSFCRSLHAKAPMN